MGKQICLLFLFGLLASNAIAEARWCSITGRGSTDNLVYPQIARASRVSGVVVSRILYQPSGTVLRVETVSGIPLLSSSISQQLMYWTFKTDAAGEDICQSLVITDLRLGKPEYTKVAPTPQPTPTIFRITISVEPMVFDAVCYDPPLRKRSWFKFWRRKTN
jgi:hypothetical protein